MSSEDDPKADSPVRDDFNLESGTPKKKAAKKRARKAARKKAKPAADEGGKEEIIDMTGRMEFSPDEEPEARPRGGERGERKSGRGEGGEDAADDSGPREAGPSGGKDRDEGRRPGREHSQDREQDRPQDSPESQGGGHPHHRENRFKNKKAKKNKKQRWQNQNPNQHPKKKRFREEETPIEFGELLDFEGFDSFESLDAMAGELGDGAPFDYDHVYNLSLAELREEAQRNSTDGGLAPNRDQLINALVAAAAEAKRPILASGVLELLDDEDGGLLVFERDNYRIKALSVYVPQVLIEHYGLQRGHIVRARIHPHRENESCPFAVRIESVMGRDPETLAEIVPFTERVPYYPLQRILMESESAGKWDGLSMRVVDCLTPVGFGQRGLIVAPPRTGKTVLLQGMANAIQTNYPDAHLIILLIDERPEEVTDFRRQVKGEVISSTFDESAESHVHAAEMVIEKARRMVEIGKDVVILLDSITRLARAYNTTMPSSGKILSGGVEANALQKPKRFFGSARNIEDGGSLTIIATALVETGSKMDEVIFEEFKGTGNMELHLDRGLSDKRIFPALSMDKSGTRKEELLYHPDEMEKIYSLRRAMKGLPSTDAMEMLIQRIKKTKTNAEFLMSVAR